MTNFSSGGTDERDRTTHCNNIMSFLRERDVLKYLVNEKKKIRLTWKSSNCTLEIWVLRILTRHDQVFLPPSLSPDHGFPKEYNHTLEHTELCNTNNFYYAI